jgi:transcription-repair coupling factor (superfamily II helicase)
VFGAALYSYLLKRAMQGTRGCEDKIWVPELNLPVPELLPSDYVKSEAVRLEMYSRAAKAGSREELDALEREVLRRFGAPPPAAHEFFDLARLRLTCRDKDLVKLDVGPEAIAATSWPGARINRYRGCCGEMGDRFIYCDGGGDKSSQKSGRFF